jgi:hypothetical protein
MSLGVAGIEYRPTSNLVASTRRQALVLMGRLAVVLFSSQPTLCYDEPTVHREWTISLSLSVYALSWTDCPHPMDSLAVQVGPYRPTRV